MTITNDAVRNLSSVMAMMYKSGRYTDLTIKCKGITFKVHKAVVCLQSAPLAAAVDGKFKEATTGELELDESDAHIVEKMLSFMYTGDYAESEHLADSQTRFDIHNEVEGPLMSHVKVYVLGDQWDIKPLKDLAKNKYAELVSREFEFHKTSFIRNLQLLYHDTADSDRILKDIAITAAAESITELLKRYDFVKLCKANGEIAFDVLEAASGKPKPSGEMPWTSRCPNCKTKNFQCAQGWIGDNTYQCVVCGTQY